jgi:poly-gamma-glutamate synthesis protein (capsule biosynthesis protein)
MKGGIGQAAAQCDFLLVYFHWGTEFRHDVGDAQIEMAHAAVDFGASAVVGAHPHVLQGRETYNGAPIYYSIGNFVFDKQIPPGTDEALILHIHCRKKRNCRRPGASVVIKDCRPRLAEGPKAAEIEADLIRYSRRFEP